MSGRMPGSDMPLLNLWLQLNADYADFYTFFQMDVTSLILGVWASYLNPLTTLASRVRGVLFFGLTKGERNEIQVYYIWKM